VKILKRWLVKCGACHDRFDMEDPQAGWCERAGRCAHTAR